MQKKDLRRAQGILKDILAGKKVRMSTGASSQDVPFEVPNVQPGETDCQLCYQSFKSSQSLKHHVKTHTETQAVHAVDAAKSSLPGLC